MSTIGSVVITPDFIDHPWVPLQSAHLQNNFVKIHWPDGAHLQAYSLWLAENSEGIGVEPLVRESLIDPADLPAADALVDASVDQQGALLLRPRLGKCRCSVPVPVVMCRCPWLTR